MLNENILFLITILVLINSCEKEPENLTTKIDFQFTDDASPVRVRFFSYTEWQINDTLIVGNGGFPHEYALEYIFNKEGNYEIELNGKANRLKISGIDLNNNDFNITDDEISIKFDYFNGSTYETFERIILVSTINDTISFPNDLIIKMSDIELPDRIHYLNFYIKGLSTDTLYFSGIFWLHFGYFDRLYNDSDNYRKYRVSGENGEGDVFFVVDWFKE